MNVKIDALEAYTVRVPLERPLQVGAMQIHEREYAVVEMRAAGKCGRFFGHTRNAPVAATVENCIQRSIEGGTLAKYRELYQTTVRKNVCLGTHGVFWRALSLVDCAYHDLFAQLEGMPLYALLGGERRVTPCVLVGGYPSPEETEQDLKRQMASFAERQPHAVKIASCTRPVDDTQRLRACRSALGAKPLLMIDCFWSFASPEPLLEVAPRWRDLNLGWVEDPFAFDDYTSMARFAEQSGLPLAVGDEQSGDRAFERLMSEGQVNVLRLDATVCGGVTAFLRVARRAQDRGIPVATHVFHPLHAHLASATQGVQYIETILPETGIEAFHHLWTQDFEWKEGGYLPPLTAGVGVAWDEDALKRYRVE